MAARTRGSDQGERQRGASHGRDHCRARRSARAKAGRDRCRLSKSPRAGRRRAAPMAYRNHGRRLVTHGSSAYIVSGPMVLFPRQTPLKRRCKRRGGASPGTDVTVSIYIDGQDGQDGCLLKQMSAPPWLEQKVTKVTKVSPEGLERMRRAGSGCRQYCSELNKR